MNSQSYNLIWIRPDFAKEGEDFTRPIREDYLNNLFNICKINSGVDVRFWVDFKRLSAEQQAWLKREIESGEMSNLQLLDLRSIDLYRDDYIFNTEGTDDRWTAGQPGKTHIFGVVDAAKILVCTEGDYEQQIFSDLDIRGLDVNSEEIQEKLDLVGMIIGGAVRFENQILGFNSSRRRLALDLFELTRELAEDGQTGWEAIHRLADKLKREGFDLTDFSILEGDLYVEGKEVKMVPETGLGINKE